MFFGGCPPPPVTSPATRLNFRRATWLPFSGSFPKGATRFYPGAQEKSFDLSLASLSASATGVITTANRSAAVLSQSLTTPFADPFAGLEGRNPRDGESYTEKIFSGQFSMCFIFRKMIYSIFDERNCMSRNFRLPVARHLRCVTIAILSDPAANRLLFSYRFPSQRKESERGLQ